MVCENSNDANLPSIFQCLGVKREQTLGKPQFFVSKYERGERRLDFIEFIAIAEIINLDVHDFIERYTEEVAAQEIRYLPRDASG